MKSLFRYKNASLPVHERVEDLLARMSVEEKIAQLRSQMLFAPEDPRRDPVVENVRSLTHFAHYKGQRRTPGECAAINNADIRRSIASSRWGVHDLLGSVALPVKQLCGFERIHLAAGEEKRVSFTLDERHLAIWNAQMQRVVEPGSFEIMAGTSSEEIRLTGILKVKRKTNI